VDHGGQSGHFYLAESGHFYLGITGHFRITPVLLTEGAFMLPILSRLTIDEISLTNAGMVNINGQSRDFRVTTRGVSLIIVRRQRVRRSKTTCFQPKSHLE
jgi:hypothetical protein